MKSAACLICGIVKLTACMKGCKNKTLRRYSFGMHIHWDPSSIIFYCTGTVLLKNYMDTAAVPCKVLIHRIVYDLIYQMVQSLSGYASDVHTGALSHGLEALQDRDTARIISVFFCHSTDSFLFYTRTFVCIILKIYVLVKST